ncbi:hypothetical protein DM828_02445 [Pseudomonas umsongensis]|nr:hypothetical protein [Pseudomonas umsongensis]
MKVLRAAGQLPGRNAPEPAHEEFLTGLEGAADDVQLEPLIPTERRVEPGGEAFHKSFLHFAVAQILDQLCEGTLRPVLINTLLDRATGGMLITTLLTPSPSASTTPEASTPMPLGIGIG